MLPFQLGFSVALVVSAGASLAASYAARPRLIKLEVDGEYEPLEGASDDTRRDAFDILEPEDTIDGYPINANGFWKQMRLVKFSLTVFLALLAITDALSLGYYAAATTPPSAAELASGLLRLSFDAYVLALSARLVAADEVEVHWAGICHLSALTALAAILRTVSLILPSSHGQIDSLTSGGKNGFEWTSLALLFVSTVIAINTPRGPPLHFPPERIYSPKMLESFTDKDTSSANVCAVVQSSVFDFLLFSFTTAIANLGHTAESLEVRDLPIVPATYRASNHFAKMRNATLKDEQEQEKANLERRAYGQKRKDKWFWQKEGTGFPLLLRLFRINASVISVQITLAGVTAISYYIPAWFLQHLVRYLELNPDRTDKGWGWIYCAGLFFFHTFNHILGGQLWSLSTTSIQVALKVQLNTILFAKTLMRKDVATSSSSISKSGEEDNESAPAALDAEASEAIRPVEPAAETEGPVENGDAAATKKSEKDEDEDFSSKSQIMTLMTTDVDRVADFAWHLFTLIDAPTEIVIGSIYLYNLLGSSSFLGLLVTCLFLPLNHYASKFVVVAQDNLMKARDERVSLMNEILGGIRMLKFMAWERNFEGRVLRVRDRELKYQRRNYIIEVIFNAVWEASPVFVTVVAFWHYTVIRGEYLSPSIAFTSLSVFNELKYALNALPETFINMLQGFVSLRRIEKYLASPEVSPVQPLSSDDAATIKIALQSATITWPQDRTEGRSRSVGPSASATPSLAGKFVLRDLTINIPLGELTLVCGKLGSGKSLLLLSFLGETDLLTGQIICPRTPPEALAMFSALEYIAPEDWVVPGVVAYVPQTTWLQNASIKDNILFSLPYDAKRYNATLEACALVADLKIIEDGDEAEIGERGVNLSGGQKARVSLARAIYSRASILLLDDVLSAVDAHTARHIFDECLKGPLVAGRTIVLVSHHVQLCAPGASYIVALENGSLTYAGDRDGFLNNDVSAAIIKDDDDEQPTADSTSSVSSPAPEEEALIEETTDVGSASETSKAAAEPKKVAKKLYDEEKRAVGRIAKDIWLAYFRACGGWAYWILFGTIFLLASLTPIANNGWLSIWASAPDAGIHPLKYVGIYAAINLSAVVITTLRWFVLYEGSIHASGTLHRRLLETVLFAKIRFHDTVSRGRLLNRFGKDLETIDSNQSDNFGRTVIYGLNTVVTVITVTVVGGPYFLVAILVLGSLYYRAARIYGQTSRDMRRLDSVTRSPLYSMYGETIAGVTIVRAFGASTKFLRDMQQHVDTVLNPFYWMWSLNRWLSIRFNLLSAGVVGATAVAVLLNKSISASMAGFALAFASNITNDLLFMVRRFVGLEQSMVALERVNEYSILPREAPEFIEPRPPASWPEHGKLEVENLVIRYAPDLPNVLHDLTFTVEPKSKIGVLGRTGGGKSTLALSFFRFVEATEGKILVDGINIADIGLTDLRSRLTIIPQDPTILSGTLRSTLDVFEEYEDVEIFEALRRVHLIPSEAEDSAAIADGQSIHLAVNANVFRNLDSPVSEGGDNFSAGEKQLICMARAILKKSRVLLMDEATASVDYATDELISRTIRKEFADSTILTIAHRLRTVIDYDKVLVLDKGRIVEYDSPATLLANESSMFYALCKATGRKEFAELQRMASAGQTTSD